ncbi:MAG: hypothetical protein AAFR46_20695 [Pseudomonadota bacterium]
MRAAALCLAMLAAGCAAPPVAQPPAAEPPDTQAPGTQDLPEDRTYLGGAFRALTRKYQERRFSLTFIPQRPARFDPRSSGAGFKTAMRAYVFRNLCPTSTVVYFLGAIIGLSPSNAVLVDATCV